MRRLFAAFLTLLFVWNSVPGGMAALVLCFHPEGAAHVELLENKADFSSCCNGLENPAEPAHCTSCVDLVLETKDLGSIRPNEMLAVDVPAPMLANVQDSLPGEIFHPGVDLAVQYPTRGPPHVESLSQMISRIVVLRL